MTIYPLQSYMYLILLATCAPGFHLLPPNLQLFLGHGQLHPVNHHWLCETTPTQGHCPLNLAEPPYIYWDLPGCKHCTLTQSTQLGYSLCPCRSHTSATMKARAVPLRTLPRGGAPPRAPPFVRFSAGGAKNPWIFSPKSALHTLYLVIFTHLNHFLRENCPFMTHKYVIST